MRESDKEEQIMQGIKLITKAFRIIDKEDTGYIETEPFKEMLMNMGYKWSEEQADEFLKEADPKGEGKFLIIELVRKLIKR